MLDVIVGVRVKQKRWVKQKDIKRIVISQ